MGDAPIKRWSVVAGLGTSQTLAWASSYYLVAILAQALMFSSLTRLAATAALLAVAGSQNEPAKN